MPPLPEKWIIVLWGRDLSRPCASPVMTELVQA